MLLLSGSLFPHLFNFNMPLLILLGLLFALHTPAACSTAINTISPGQGLVCGDKLVSMDGKFALGFFQTGSKSYNAFNWYLGIWFNKVPKITPVWVANRDNPITEPALARFTISQDGNLVILNQASNSTIWSSQVSIRTNTTVVVLWNNGNLVLQNTSSSSDILWQSFDHPTDTFLPGAKLGRDKITGLTRRLVSRKNLIDPASGLYCYELDHNRLILTLLNSSMVYWSSGEWNGQYFSSIPEMLSHYLIDYKFVNNKDEEYFTYTLLNDTMIMNHVLDISGQMKTFIWDEGSQGWFDSYSNPKAQCDVDAICGPFTVCNDNTDPYCRCMKGFSIRSQEDWELSDRSSGCVRNTPLNCGINRSTAGMTDEFYCMSTVGLPQNAHKVYAAASAGKCAEFCLKNCSCMAYSYIDDRCSVWYEELLNVKQQHTDSTIDTNGGFLYLRLAAKDMQPRKHGRGVIIGVASLTSVTALGLLAFILLMMIRRNNRGWSGGTLKNLQGGGGIIAFRYIDLQRATRNFSEKLGAGGFGAVFKGYLSESITVAVKRLDGACQGEKQFRAEVSSVGIIQHINLVRLIGFCCEGEQRLLAYEHMPNRSLDIHLFQNDNNTVLNWSTRYKIALGVARGLAYLHESCQDLIIHCDVKPQNILLDASFVAKIADFGMAKLMGRGLSRVLTTARGTAGYLAPEWISGVAITTKVDVYSYGMVLMEIISGRRSNSPEECTAGGDHVAFFPVHVAHMLPEGDVASLVDDKLCGDVNLEQAERLCKVACWCIQDDEFDRPTMGDIVRILEGLFDLDIPPMPRLLQAITRSSLPTSNIAGELEY